MVSKIQWKPFWLATQLCPQNDWFGWQNGVNYDVCTQAPPERHKHKNASSRSKHLAWPHVCSLASDLLWVRVAKCCCQCCLRAARQSMQKVADFFVFFYSWLFTQASGETSVFKTFEKTTGVTLRSAKVCASVGACFVTFPSLSLSPPPPPSPSLSHTHTRRLLSPFLFQNAFMSMSVRCHFVFFSLLASCADQLDPEERQAVGCYCGRPWCR